MRLVSFLLTLSVVAGPSARAEPLEIHGTTGYVGEYELSGSVSEQDLNGKKEFSGPLTVKHVGLCTHDGPRETVGEIRFELAKLSSRIRATLDFDGSKCTYEGFLSESYHGFMDCGGGGAFRSDFGPNDPTSGIKWRSQPDAQRSSFTASIRVAAWP